ncbi:MAG TPA: serine hydrolase domain-containing protein [Terriglobales bacterium]|nr:serine hydrolase domain-containing protein [Acidobacteriaceae bacterium]HKR30275.1 serine hydrolase domain-containing protein [Terriglobales bacterium]
MESAYPHGTGITAFAKTKLKGGKLYIDLECGNSEPCRIKSYQMVALSPGPETFLPKPEPDVPTETRLETLKRAFEEASDGQLFSGAVLIARHGKILFRGAYGDADRARHIPISTDTPFFIASLGKLFTGVAVAQLVSEGKLSYDEPIIRYLPGYPNKAAASKITLRELLTHTSGLADIFSRQSPGTPVRRLTDYYPLFAYDPLLFEPGHGQSYSNTGFLVASMIVESVSGEEFRHYLADHIFRPAGMRRTSSEEPRGRAIRYYRDNVDDPLNTGAPWVSAEAFYGKLLRGPAVGPGGEYSTIEDLFRFAEALESGKLLDHKGFEVLIRQGLGCECSSQESNLIFAHTGGGPGVDSGLKLYVERNVVSVFLSNYSPPFPQALMDYADVFLGTS